MKSKDVCQSVLKKLLTDGTENLADDISSHISECDKCRSEYEKIEKTRKLISASAPDVPDLRRAVTEKIKSQGITIDKNISSRRRRHIPLGTIAAAAAILAVYVSVYGTKLPNMVFKGAEKADESIKLSDNITAAPDIMLNVPQAVSGAGVKDAGESEMFEKSSNIYYFEESFNENKAVVNDDASKTDSVGGINKLQSGATGASREIRDESPEADTTYNDSDGDESTGVSYKSSSGYITKGHDVLMTYPTMNMLGFISGNNFDEFSDGVGYVNRYGNQDYTELDGEEIFEIMSQNYPDRVSYEMFEAVGSEIYKEFVLILSDFETEYTEDELLRYSKSVLLR